MRSQMGIGEIGGVELASHCPFIKLFVFFCSSASSDLAVPLPSVNWGRREQPVLRSVYNFCTYVVSQL